jgi:SAM-dependent methyltransferase
MTSSALNEWNENPDPETLAYHDRHAERVGSTAVFAAFIEPWMEDSCRVFDVGCGAGGATEYLAREFPQTQLFGLDVSGVLLEKAKASCPTVKNFYKEDLTDISIKYHRIDGVVSLQTFSWMPEIETPLAQICTKINPRWLAFSSLFYEGDISCQIIVDEPKRPRRSYYNIYSIPRTIAFLKERGYMVARVKPFYIDVDLPVPDNLNIMKTYTGMTEDGMRLQFSGPLMLPWYFLCFEKMA